MDSLTYRDNKSKLLFFAFYVVATGLIFFVVSSFWQQNPFNFRPAHVDESSMMVQNDAESEVQRLKTVLAEREQKIASLENSLQAKGTTAQPAGTAPTQTATADEKDKLIASLQTQLAQKEYALQQAQSGSSTGSDGSEWKQKYAALKASFDKLLSNEKELKSAYKTVSDDNRRLLTQLESLRKG